MRRLSVRISDCLNASSTQNSVFASPLYSSAYQMSFSIFSLCIV